MQSLMANFLPGSKPGPEVRGAFDVTQPDVLDPGLCNGPI